MKIGLLGFFRTFEQFLFSRMQFELIREPTFLQNLFPHASDAVKSLMKEAKRRGDYLGQFITLNSHDKQFSYQI